MINRDSGFQDLESGIQSNNISSVQLFDMVEQIFLFVNSSFFKHQRQYLYLIFLQQNLTSVKGIHSICIDQPSPSGGYKLDPKIEFSQLQQLDALKLKRDIFDNTHKQAINQGHKADVNEEDCLMSNLSGKRSEPQGSIGSISYNLKIQKPLTVNPKQNKSNKSIQIQKKLDQDDIVIASPVQKNRTNNVGLKSDAKIVKYQSFVQQLEEQQEQKERTKIAQINRDIVKIKISQFLK